VATANLARGLDTAMLEKPAAVSAAAMRPARICGQDGATRPNARNESDSLRLSRRAAAGSRIKTEGCGSVASADTVPTPELIVLGTPVPMISAGIAGRVVGRRSQAIRARPITPMGPDVEAAGDDPSCFPTSFLESTSIALLEISRVRAKCTRGCCFDWRVGTHDKIALHQKIYGLAGLVPQTQQSLSHRFVAVFEYDKF
jgi:hypothetical protein